jgi:hypothetical protein
MDKRSGHHLQPAIKLAVEGTLDYQEGESLVAMGALEDEYGEVRVANNSDIVIERIQRTAVDPFGVEACCCVVTATDPYTGMEAQLPVKLVVDGSIPLYLQTVRWLVARASRLQAARRLTTMGGNHGPPHLRKVARQRGGLILTTKPITWTPDPLMH